jgi:hypothetical protein
MSIDHISVVNTCTKHTVDPRWLAFATEALAIQLLEYVCPAWSIPPCGVTLEAVGASLPSSETAVLLLVDTDYDAGLLGAHGYLAGTPYAVVDVGQAAGDMAKLFEAMSHEACEMAVNPRLDRWQGGPASVIAPGVGSGWVEYAVEICDPVQRRRYPVTARMMGESMTFEAADFVMPAWFGLPNRPSNGGDFSWMCSVKAPFTVVAEGYALRKSNGRVVTELMASTASKLARANSRTTRTMEGR